MTENMGSKEEDASFEDGDKAEPIPPEDIVSYNELRSCADLFRMYQNGKLEIQPDFQRDKVWTQEAKTLFIDSLVKGLPIPSMCFSLDYKNGTWKVIDGLQRMDAIISFLSPNLWQLSKLTEIDPRLSDVKNIDLANGTQDQKRIFSRVEDASIPLTVIRCDYLKKSHMAYLFTIFHRLNSGGITLTNQEIRNCIYNGEFNNLLKKFDASNKDWKKVKSKIWGKMDRFRSIEIILRFLAYGERLENYKGNLARFLNEYMHEQSNNKSINLDAIERALTIVAKKALEMLSNEDKKVPLVFAESLLVALYINNEKISDMSSLEINSTYARIKNLPVFSTARASHAMSSEENVKKRLHAIIAEMAN